jgi:hypothetical protein
MSEKRTKKLLRKIKIYDLEQKKLYIKTAPLRFISSLEGITQYSTQKNLYLCGSNKLLLNSSESTGSYLFRYDLEDNFKQPSVLVNSAYVHYNPMIVLINEDILVVIGGKEQIFCEKYSISLNNWRKIPILPEERYKGCLLVYQKESNLFLFGGMTNGKFNSSILFLNFRSIGGWERIILKENDYLLKRNNFIAFQLDKDKNSFFICGGEAESNIDNDFIVQYDPVNKKVKKQFIKSNITNAKFKNQTIIDFDGKFFSFVDKEENIYLIEKNKFGITIIDTKEIIINDFNNN